MATDRLKALEAGIKQLINPEMQRQGFSYDPSTRTFRRPAGAFMAAITAVLMRFRNHPLLASLVEGETYLHRGLACRVMRYDSVVIRTSTCLTILDS